MRDIPVEGEGVAFKHPTPTQLYVHNLPGKLREEVLLRTKNLSPSFPPQQRLMYCSFFALISKPSPPRPLTPYFFGPTNPLQLQAANLSRIVSELEIRQKKRGKSMSRQVERKSFWVFSLPPSLRPLFLSPSLLDSPSLFLFFIPHPPFLPPVRRNKFPRLVSIFFSPSPPLTRFSFSELSHGTLSAMNSPIQAASCLNAAGTFFPLSVKHHCASLSPWIANRRAVFHALQIRTVQV